MEHCNNDEYASCTGMAITVLRSMKLYVQIRRTGGRSDLFFTDGELKAEVVFQQLFRYQRCDFSIESDFRDLGLLEFKLIVTVIRHFPLCRMQT